MSVANRSNGLVNERRRPFEVWLLVVLMFSIGVGGLGLRDLSALEAGLALAGPD